ncbi:MAG: ATP phosphoribosyltransferase regulatory subunit [Syntrophomonadaceae bacterium]|nr:ATP phosphoribosyltransferase regulatory subunit [Syntrophomonadaceae bacterium]
MAVDKYPGTWPIPAGTRDLLPGEARRRRALENQMVTVFERWGYQEVATPTLEYFDTLAIDLGEEVGEELYRLLDRDGRLLVLRPDMTTPIARLVATRLRNQPLPLRLFYLANVFRYESPQAGRLREFGQAGVELIGSSGPEADAELIALAVEALRTAGLQEFQISLGEVQVINGLMEETNLPESVIRSLKRALTQKDLVGLEDLLLEHQVPLQKREMILGISNFQGGLEVIQEFRKLTANQRTIQALDYLEQVWSSLIKLGVDPFVRLDLGVLRGFEYYTGIVFEGYSSDLGFPLCGGGRYDNLLSKFGYPCPATGFAVGIERLLLALDNQNKKQ